MFVKTFDNEVPLHIKTLLDFVFGSAGELQFLKKVDPLIATESKAAPFIGQTSRKEKEMQFQITTDYAVRIVGYLHVEKRTVQISELSEVLKISSNYMLKVLLKLMRNGIISSSRGRNGGYFLVKPAKEISMFDIISIIENDFFLNRCLCDDTFCSRDAIDHCPVRKLFVTLQDDFAGKLKSVTIADLWKDSSDFRTSPVLLENTLKDS